MNDIRIVRIVVQLGIVVFVGLTFNAAMAIVAEAADIAQLAVIFLYVILVAIAYKMNDIWQFCQKNFKIANLNSQKRISH